MPEREKDVRAPREARIGDQDVTTKMAAAKELSCPGDCKSLKVIWEKVTAAGEFLSVRF